MVDLDKLIVAKGFKKYPKSNKSPNLVTLFMNMIRRIPFPDFGDVGDVDGVQVALVETFGRFQLRTLFTNFTA